MKSPRILKRSRMALRTLLCVLFLGGGISHLVLGQVSREGYAAFGQTAYFGWLGDLWTSFVMPNIALLSILLGFFEITLAIGLALTGRRQRITAVVMLGFYAFLFVLGSGWETGSAGEDFLKNRLPVLILAIATLPFALWPDRRTLWRSWWTNRSTHRRAESDAT